MSVNSVLFDHPGPSARRRNTVITVLGWLAVLALLGALGWGLRNEFTALKLRPFADGESWRFYIVPGLLNTLKAAGIAVLTSVVLGLALGCGRLSPVRLVSRVCGVLVEVFRAIPVLLMMIFWYYIAIYVLVLGREVAPLFGVVMGLTLYNASVIAELVRSGVHSLPRGQREAGLAIGMSEGQVLTSVQLPQAITAMLPSLVSQLVVILKDTALGTAILYTDLLKQLNDLATYRGNVVAAMVFAAVVYIALNFALTSLAQLVERRLRRSSRGGAPMDADRNLDAVNAGAMASQVETPGSRL
ncbi:ABC transporter permease subunit [Auraticoccus sp. F435]|uniref:ABC transporter permease subunit n=1 Tax=Auraticoccus cholistanensis TaxID=2656650 RepID=A0A6A9UVK3_9ACTN|nr:amino acid ABC transporter permease [Auraticoccus cholistanensis]MVA75662.1 ABC transporter permease subunit [Auraticoccus cholistanensis]